MTRLIRAAALLATTALCAGAAPAADNNSAAPFGARDAVLGMALSPDGKSLVVLRPNGARGAAAVVVPVDHPEAAKVILTSSGAPDRLTRCRWVSNERLACGVYMIGTAYGQKTGATRMLALDADGGNMKQLSAQDGGNALGIALNGGEVIDWLSDGSDDAVLMARVFVPQQSTGTFLAQSRGGVGVERLNTRTLARQTVETPNGSASDYITDGHGTVRVMGVSLRNDQGQERSITEYRYRKKGDRRWLPLSTVTHANYHETGFDPYAVDPTLDVAYGLENVNGRTGVYKVALDGSLKKELVLAPADADVDGLIQVGRQDRVVGATWTTDKTHATMFDPELRAFAASLAKALPNAPNVSVVDASADERRIVLFAGGDTDPGGFYLYDKPTRRLTPVLTVRPALAGRKLANVQAIHYPAADGTSVPAYLTLPPGGAAMGLPAIVLPHGGPFARDVWAFDWLPQYFASRGYAVIQPEYRGSSGYGQQWFGTNGIRGWRTAIGDIDDAGRWLVKQGIADPAKLAIVGWSYGGYAALQSQVVDPQLFKAVVAIAPVADFGAVRRDAEQGGETEQTLAEYFGDAATAEEGSPARHADRFAAPVLLFHGTDDQTVQVSQSRLMQAKLRGAGKSVQLVEFKGLDHQLDDSDARTAMLSQADAFLRRSMGL